MSKIIRSRQRYRLNDDGYTLIELLVVIAILGLLTVIAVPQVVKYLDSTKLRAAQTSVEGLSSALDLYKYDVGGYPTTMQGLQALVAPPAGVTGWNGPYIKKASMLNDPWGHAFQYRYPGEHGVYDLYSYGPKGADTGDFSHAITSWQ